MPEIQEVPKWDPAKVTVDDYKTSRPYEYLFALRHDPFLHQVRLEEMAEQARQVGVRNFKKLYSEFSRTAKKSGDTRVNIGNVTEFNNQPHEWYSGRWVANESGIVCGTDLAILEACTHPIMPVQRLINIDTDTVKVKIWYRPGRYEQYVIVDRSVLASPQSIIKLADRGIAVNSENAKALIKYLSDIESLNYAAIPEKRSVARLGWIPKYGFSPYVDGLEFDGETQYKTAFEAVTQHGDFLVWKKLVYDIFQTSITARVLVAASFASVLVEICGCLPFFVHLWSSDSGTGKTVALMVAASVWANPVIGAYIQTFNSTVVGREKMAAFCNSIPLCIDELQLGKDSRGKQQFDVYALAEGVGRTRGTKTGGVEKTATWRNCILTTGETPITSIGAGAGAFNRVIDVECKAGEDVVKGGQKIVATIKKHYGHAGKFFIEKLSGNDELVRNCFQANYLSLMYENDTTEKQAMAAALILTADQLIYEWIFIEEDWVHEKIQAGGGGLLPLNSDDMKQFLLTKAQVDVNSRAYEFLCDWVAANRNRFEDDSQGETYGKIVADTAYIIPTIFRKALDAEGYSYEGFLSWAKTTNRIRKGDGKNWTIKQRMGKSSIRCIGLVLPETESFLDEI
ncbi:MAG: DUF927 domain-containing protein [Oscillospiraceae bacterium]|nr:DUF927 domain-containing protein [Oscillospiraceae bacterium]